MQYHNILTGEQFGFWRGLSMDTATYKLMETVFDAWNYGKCVAGVFFDLNQLFGCVNRELLVNKLNF
jgi:hypothetical protein